MTRPCPLRACRPIPRGVFLCSRCGGGREAGVSEWRIIAAYPDYAVSDDGSVRRIVPDQKGRLSGKPLKPGLDTDGYPQVRLYRKARGKTQKVHRLVCEAFHGPASGDEFQVAHGDGDKLNNRASNLRWATAKENMRDRDAHGRTVRGDRHHSVTRPEVIKRGAEHWRRRHPEWGAKGERCAAAKLDERRVRAIRSDRRSLKEIAQEYAVTSQSISHIKRRKTWRHVQ